MKEQHRVSKVTDRLGQEYILEIYCDDEMALTVYIHRQNRQVGHILCNIDHEEMEIGDVIILDNVIHGQRGCFFMLLELFGWKPKRTNYRNRGLGSILLEFAIGRARQRGIKRISGFIVPHDHENTPHLVSWYQKHGFTVLRRKGDQYKDRFLLRMDLEDACG